MFYLELFGLGGDRNPYGEEGISTPFSSVADAIAEGKQLAAHKTFDFGKAAGYRIYGESDNLVDTGLY